MNICTDVLGTQIRKYLTLTEGNRLKDLIINQYVNIRLNLLIFLLQKNTKCVGWVMQQTLASETAWISAWKMREAQETKTFNIVNKEDAWKDNDRW